MEPRRLLLLNTTNHPIRLAYPYAFVQVSEVARRHAISTRRIDLFGVFPSARAAMLGRVLAEFRPTLIGITLRNTDSLLSTDYVRTPDDDPIDRPRPRNLVEQLTEGAPPYFPTHDTRDLIALLRSQTAVPIIVGGFGFSTQPHALMKFLAPDFGVIGDPEPVFARFDDLLLHRRLEDIDNLCYQVNGTVVVNRRVFHGPSPNREYDDAILADRERLFGAFSAKLPATSRAVPVEVMRGCPYRCTFCAEPTVKGNRASFRDLDVVQDELEFLRTHQLNLIWFVCSEINAKGNEFALELAERITRLNETRPEAERVRWFTYYLLRFSRTELRELRRSGFLGGWNDIPAFDDRNLKQLRVPYRTRHLVQSIQDVVAIRAEEAPTHDLDAALEERVVFDPEHRKTMLPDDMLTSPMLTLFLGNSHATVATVRETLRVAESAGIARSFDGAFIIRAERVFRAAEDVAQDNQTLSFDRSGNVAADYVHPTFRFSEDLVAQLGSRAALERFFVYIEDTFLSRNHVFRQDWCWFLAQHTSPAAFRGLWAAVLARGIDPAQHSALEPVRAVLRHVAADPSGQRTQWLFHPPIERRRVASRAADIAVRLVLEAHVEAWNQSLTPLGLELTARWAEDRSPYALTARLYERFETDEELWTFAQDELGVTRDSAAWLALAATLYRNNVQLRPEYRPFFAAIEARTAELSDSAVEEQVAS